jgi:hypothetical protein
LVVVWPGRDLLGCWAGGVESVGVDWLLPELGFEVPDVVAWPGWLAVSPVRGPGWAGDEVALEDEPWLGAAGEAPFLDVAPVPDVVPRDAGDWCVEVRVVAGWPGVAAGAAPLVWVAEPGRSDPAGSEADSGPRAAPLPAVSRAGAVMMATARTTAAARPAARVRTAT